MLIRQLKATIYEALIPGQDPPADQRFSRNGGEEGHQHAAHHLGGMPVLHEPDVLRRRHKSEAVCCRILCLAVLLKLVWHRCGTDETIAFFANRLRRSPDMRLYQSGFSVSGIVGELPWGLSDCMEERRTWGT